MGGASCAQTLTGLPWVLENAFWADEIPVGASKRVDERSRNIPRKPACTHASTLGTPMSELGCQSLISPYLLVNFPRFSPRLRHHSHLYVHRLCPGFYKHPPSYLTGMALSFSFGTGALLAVGVGAGDIATLVAVSRRIGNFITAEKGDAELLALLEEDEFNFIHRRGIIDMRHFNVRWDQRIRLLANGRPRRIEGDKVERLLSSSSQWTAMMICIIATLDEFAEASTVRNVIQSFLQHLFGIRETDGSDGFDDLNSVLLSSLSERINGWRSAAAASPCFFITHLSITRSR